MPPKKVGRKTNKKKKGNKCSRSSPGPAGVGGGVGTTTASTGPSSMPPSNQSATSTSSTPNHPINHLLHPSLALPPEEYFALIKHSSILVDGLGKRYGDKVRSVCEDKRRTLQKYMDSLMRFQQLGRLEEKEKDAEVDQLKINVLMFCKSMMSDVDGMGLLSVEKTLIPILAKTNPFISIEDFFTAITDTGIIVEGCEAAYPEQTREIGSQTRSALEAMKDTLERVQQLGTFEDNNESDVKDLKKSIRFLYDTLRTTGNKLVGILGR